LSQISGVRPGLTNRSASTSFVPFSSTTMKPRFVAPGLSFTYANRPYESSPANGCPAGQSVCIEGSMSPKACSPQSS
jgi:hypothetical protein